MIQLLMQEEQASITELCWEAYHQHPALAAGHHYCLVPTMDAASGRIRDPHQLWPAHGIAEQVGTDRN